MLFISIERMTAFFIPAQEDKPLFPQLDVDINKAHGPL